MQSEVDLSYALTGFSLDDVVVFDTETTGLDPYGGDEIVSIGICDGHGNKLFYSLVKPTRKRGWKEAEAIHGISPQDVKDAPKIKQIADEIRSHILGDKLVVGYNVEYDLMMLDAAGVIDGMPPARFDVMRQYAMVHGTSPARYGREGYQWSKLTECASYYGYRFTAHNSLEDSVAAAHCYRSMLADPIWANRRFSEIAAQLKRVPLKQNKASAENVIHLVSKGATAPVPAELRLASITQGVNKGAPRYECFIDDLCVGVQGYGEMEGISRLFMASEQEQFPRSIKCQAIMTVTAGKAKCTANITEDGIIAEAIGENLSKKSLPISKERADSPRDNECNSKKPQRKVARYALSAFILFTALYGLTEFEPSISWLLTEIIVLLLFAFVFKWTRGNSE